MTWAVEAMYRPNAWKLLYWASCGLQQVAHLSVFQEGELAVLIESRHRRPIKHCLVKLDSTKHTEMSIGRLAHTDIIVGVGGRVNSFEVKQSHLDIARQNITRWTKSWDSVHSQSRRRWPDNVSFHCTSLEEAREHLDEPVDAVFLDLPHANSVLSTVVDILEPCGVAVLFLPNITQAVGVDACIRSNNLSLKTEEIVGVSQEQWTVKPARTKRLIAHEDTHPTPAGESPSLPTKLTDVALPAYICRPSHRQPPHTGFLMKIRRLVEGSSSV